MRAYVEYADLIVALHRTCEDKAGRPKAQLALGERLQLVTLFVLALSKHPLVSLGIEPGPDRMLQAAMRSLESSPEWAPVYLAARLSGGSPLEIASMLGMKRNLMARLEAALDADPAAAEQLPARLAAAGSAYTIDALTLRSAGLYRVVKAALAAADAAGAADAPGAAGAAGAAGALQVAREAAAKLVALTPRWPRYLLLQSEVEVAAGNLGESMHIAEVARQAAKEQNAHYWAAQAALNLACKCFMGSRGPTYSRSQVEALIDDAEAEFKASKPWTGPCCSGCLAEVADARRQLRLAVSRARPGAAEVPAAPEAYAWGGADRTSSRVVCDGCGQVAVEVKKCSRCRSAAYCSKECQARHWKQGGHKAKCRLAA